MENKIKNQLVRVEKKKRSPSNPFKKTGTKKIFKKTERNYETKENKE